MNPISRVLGRLIGLTACGLSCGQHITRYEMYRRLAKHKGQGDILAVSGSATLAFHLVNGPHRIRETSYPGTDLCALPDKDGRCDMVVADQVLEHVADPAAAVAESVRVVRPGGLVVLTTCCVNPIHGRPDYWRFTPDGLRLLVPGGAEVVDAGGWGNPLVWLVVALGARFAPVPDARWHPLHWLATWDHPDWPVVTWLVLKKST